MHRVALTLGRSLSRALPSDQVRTTAALRAYQARQMLSTSIILGDVRRLLGAPN